MIRTLVSFVIGIVFLTGCSGASPAHLGGGGDVVWHLPPVANNWGPHETVMYAYPDGVPLWIDVYYPIPPAVPNGAVVMSIHGGGWTAFDRTNLSGYEIFLRRAGYTIVSPDYRLTPAVSFLQQVTDCRAALTWTQEHGARFGMHPGKIAVMGVSAGAHLSALIASAPSRPAGSWAQETKLVRPLAVIGISGAYDVTGGFADDKPLLQWMIGDPALAAEASPVTWLDPSDPPFLLLHGDSEREPITPLSQAERMTQAADDAGVTAELVVIRQGDHGLVPHPDFTEMYPSRDEIGATMVQFLDRWMLDR